MKKCLLLACVAGLAFSAGAQNRVQSIKLKDTYRRAELAGTAKSIANPSAPATRKEPLVVTNTAISDIPLGWAGNAFGGFTRPSRSICYADPGLNAVTVIHRSGPSCTPGDGTAGTGSIMVDYSKDGGATFNAAPSLGPVWDAGAELARYPSGVIYNPSANTNPDNAYICVYGPCTGPAMPGGSAWIAHFNGSAQLGNPSTTQNQDTYWFDSTVSYIGLIPDATVITQQGVIWNIDQTFDGTGNYNLTDSLLLTKGTWNTGTNMVDYTAIKIPFTTVDQNLSGTSIAFAPNGQTGYVVAICNNDLAIAADTSLFLVVLKTTDGGATWGAPIKIAVDGPAGTALGGSGSYSGAFNPDCTVDKNGNLHVICNIHPALGGGSISIAPGTWGQFAVYTKDGGATWNFKLLDKPQTFSYTSTGTNAITEYPRGHVSMNWAGDQIAYVWFDTDTNSFAGGENSNPNAIAMSYDVTGDSFGTLTNLTANTVADGAVTYGAVSYYMLNNGEIPIAYQAFSNPGDELSCMQYHYLKGVLLSGVNEIDNSVFSIADAYPNPASSSTIIDVTMKTAEKITLDIVNMLGQSVYSTSANLNTGKHSFQVNTSNWQSGVYFYSIKSKDFTGTKKLVIE